jgi:AcrR family transcriptional regulator
MALSVMVITHDVSQCNQLTCEFMARWETDAVGRLQEAALQLYREPGYDQVTVADIAARAGLTRRTFFRYFADKREVLFYGTEKVEALIAEGIRAAPEGTPALAVVAAALAPISQRSDDDPAIADQVRQRHVLIQTYADLRERELAKHASLASAIAAALRRRGVAEPTARLAAEAALTAFTVGFEQWANDPRRRKMRHHVREAMRALGALVLEQLSGEQTLAHAGGRGSNPR